MNFIHHLILFACWLFLPLALAARLKAAGVILGIQVLDYIPVKH